jgi:hypothetical protein
MINSKYMHKDSNQNSELLPMADNVFRVAIAQHIAKWELMYERMHRKDKTLCVHHV